MTAKWLIEIGWRYHLCSCYKYAHAHTAKTTIYRTVFTAKYICRDNLIIAYFLVTTHHFFVC